MNLLEVTVVDVGINLRCGDRGVAEECLDGSDVGSFFNQARSEAMSEGVWSDFFGDANELGISFDKIFDGISTEMVS